MARDLAPFQLSLIPEARCPPSSLYVSHDGSDRPGTPDAQCPPWVTGDRIVGSKKGGGCRTPRGHTHQKVSLNSKNSSHFASLGMRCCAILSKLVPIKCVKLSSYARKTANFHEFWTLRGAFPLDAPPPLDLSVGDRELAAIGVGTSEKVGAA